MRKYCKWKERQHEGEDCERNEGRTTSDEEESKEERIDTVKCLSATSTMFVDP